jgi:two-component system sensor histidine kinase/response regulator
LKGFQAENADLIERLNAALSKKNREEAVHLVHALKGSAGNIGAESLYKITAELNTALKSKSSKSDKIKKLSKKLATELDQVLEIIAAADLPVEQDHAVDSDDLKIDPESFRKSVQVLADCLADNDAQAGELFADLKARLARMIPAAELKQIEDAIIQYDYDQAFASLNEFIRWKEKKS